MLLEIGAHSRSKVMVAWLLAKANFMSKFSLKEATISDYQNALCNTIAFTLTKPNAMFIFSCHYLPD